MPKSNILGEKLWKLENLTHCPPLNFENFQRPTRVEEKRIEVTKGNRYLIITFILNFKQHHIHWYLSESSNFFLQRKGRHLKIQTLVILHYAFQVIMSTGCLILHYIFRQLFISFYVSTTNKIDIFCRCDPPKHRQRPSIILFTTLSSRGRAFTSSENRTNHSCFYNVAQYKSHCSSMLVRELKYYMRPKNILQFQRM